MTTAPDASEAPPPPPPPPSTPPTPPPPGVPATPATPGVPSNPANALRFDVIVDGIDLGSFTQLSGISATYETTTYAEGGENSFVHKLPGRLTYGNITLTRPVDMLTYGLVLYFRRIALWGTYRRSTAIVRTYDDNRMPVNAWFFADVWPVTYTGPSLSASQSAVATESFEFAHGGFMDMGMS